MEIKKRATRTNAILNTFQSFILETLIDSLVESKNEDEIKSHIEVIYAFSKMFPRYAEIAALLEQNTPSDGVLKSLLHDILTEADSVKN